MPPGVLQLVNRFEHVSGLSEDQVENVLHVGATTEPSGGDITLFMQEVRDFFITTAGGMTATVGSYISESILRTANKAHVLAYWVEDLTGATPFGAPIATLDYTLVAAGAGDPFPEEVAFVVSYHGDLAGVPVTQANPTPPPDTMRPQQRRRGRMYLGPIQSNAAVGGAATCRPSSAFRNNVVNSFASMASGMASIVAGDFGIWSKADAEVYPYDTGWVDDAWDTQRRRGAQPTLRVPIP